MQQREAMSNYSGIEAPLLCVSPRQVLRRRHAARLHLSQYNIVFVPLPLPLPLPTAYLYSTGLSYSHRIASPFESYHSNSILLVFRALLRSGFGPNRLISLVNIRSSPSRRFLFSSLLFLFTFSSISRFVSHTCTSSDTKPFVFPCVTSLISHYSLDFSTLRKYTCEFEKFV